MKGLPLLRFVLAYGKGDPKIMLGRGTKNEIIGVTARMDWLGWQGEGFHEDDYRASIENLAKQLEVAIEDGLLREDE